VGPRERPFLVRCCDRQDTGVEIHNTVKRAMGLEPTTLSLGS
jgi:hypothetical protein